MVPFVIFLTIFKAAGPSGIIAEMLRCNSPILMETLTRQTHKYDYKYWKNTLGMGLVLHHKLLKGQRWFNGMWQLSWAQVTWSRSKGSWKGYWEHPPHSCQHRLYAVWFHAGKRDNRPNFHLETVAWEVLWEKEGPVFSFHGWSELCRQCMRTPSLLDVSTAATVQNSMLQLVWIKDL